MRSEWENWQIDDETTRRLEAWSTPWCLLISRSPDLMMSTIKAWQPLYQYNPKWDHITTNNPQLVVIVKLPGMGMRMGNVGGLVEIEIEIIMPKKALKYKRNVAAWHV